MKQGFNYEFKFILTHFSPIFYYFYSPERHQKTKSFLMFSGGVEIEHLPKTDKFNFNI